MEMLFDLVKIMMVNIVLSGDNAVVIAMCCRTLPQKLQVRAMLWGSAGAIMFRLLMTIAATYLLNIPFLSFFGGLLLIWIATKLLNDQESTDEIDSKDSFWAAVKTILVADIVMSLDNTLAIAAVAQGNITMIAVGFATSIPLIIFGSRLIMLIMEKYPIVVYVGAMLIAWTAGDLIVHDQQIGKHVLEIAQKWAANLWAVGILATIGYLKIASRKERVPD